MLYLNLDLSSSLLHMLISLSHCLHMMASKGFVNFLNISELFYSSLESDKCYYSKAVNEIMITETGRLTQFSSRLEFSLQIDFSSFNCLSKRTERIPNLHLQSE